jgi:hypothetical protein
LWVNRKWLIRSFSDLQIRMRLSRNHFVPVVALLLRLAAWYPKAVPLFGDALFPAGYVYKLMALWTFEEDPTNTYFDLDCGWFQQPLCSPCGRCLWASRQVHTWAMAQRWQCRKREILCTIWPRAATVHWRKLYHTVLLRCVV